MPAPVPNRGPLTDHLVAFLGAWPDLGVLIGDGKSADGAGWTGTPGQSNFRPSCIVTTRPASPLQRESMRERHHSWACGYQLRTIGGLRKQCDDAADRVRAAVLNLVLPESSPFTTAWSLQDVVFNSLGGVDKVGNDDAATFELVDEVQLWVTRRR